MLVFAEMQRLATSCAEDGEGVSLEELTYKDIEEIRQLKNPPVMVRRTLEVVYLLLNVARTDGRPQPPDWARVQRLLSDTSLTTRMLTFDARLLQENHKLVTYVAAEYFGSAATPLTARDERRRRTVAALRKGCSTLELARRVSALDTQEPLTYKRVFRASRATAALFRWSALAVVQALELDLAPEPPPKSPATPPPAAPVLPAVTPTPVAPAVPAPVPNLPSRLPEVKPMRPPPAPKPEPAKPQYVVPKHAEPDRHFELMCSCVFGSASLEQEGYESLQTACATYCMRRNLKIELVSCRADIETEALGQRRCVVALDWLEQNGVPREAVTISRELRTTPDDPGVVCQVVLKSDKFVRDYYLLTAMGEDPMQAGTKDTREVCAWLEEQFKCCMH